MPAFDWRRFDWRKADKRKAAVLALLAVPAALLLSTAFGDRGGKSGATGASDAAGYDFVRAQGDALVHEDGRIDRIPPRTSNLSPSSSSPEFPYGANLPTMDWPRTCGIAGVLSKDASAVRRCRSFEILAWRDLASKDRPRDALADCAGPPPGKDGFSFSDYPRVLECVDPAAHAALAARVSSGQVDVDLPVPDGMPSDKPRAALIFVPERPSPPPSPRPSSLPAPTPPREPATVFQAAPSAEPAPPASPPARTARERVAAAQAEADASSPRKGLMQLDPSVRKTAGLKNVPKDLDEIAGITLFFAGAYGLAKDGDKASYWRRFRADALTSYAGTVQNWPMTLKRMSRSDSGGTSLLQFKANGAPLQIDAADDVGPGIANLLSRGREGQEYWVKFRFRRGSDGLEEGSLTERGSMYLPEFVVDVLEVRRR